MKNSIIIEIKSVKPAKTKFGDKFAYTMKLENGETVNILKNSDNAFQLNQEIYYIEKEPVNEYGIINAKSATKEEVEAFTGKSQSTNQTPTSTYKPQSNLASFAMSYSKDLVVAGKMDITGLEATAELIYNRLASKNG